MGILCVGLIVEYTDKQGTLMLSTSAPGGGSCRAMVSDVSMVKYTSTGH